MGMPKEKASIIVLASAGVLVFIFGLWQINHNIKSPFKLRPIDKSLLSRDQIPDLQKDTDGDGIADYEETNIYGTSPYLADTDSDGTPDSQELQNGTDPNCPEGKDCNASAEPASAAVQASIPAGDAATGASIPDDLSADDIRKILKQGGMSDADLKKLDDKAIMEIYQETLKQVKGGQ